MAVDNEKKAEKKVKKCVSSIKKDMELEISETPTQYVLILNAGLITGNSREEIFDIASRYGEVLNIFMSAGKSYSFVEFREETGGEKFLTSVNGQPSLNSRIFYLCYLKSLPAEVERNLLLDVKLPEGLHVFPDFVTVEEEGKYQAAVNWDDDHGELKHRKVKHYGYAFLYDRNNVDKETPLEEKVPNVFEPVITKLKKTGLVNWDPDQLTVNQYSPGQGIPPHIDTHSAFEEALISISLGSSILMEFSHPDGRKVSVFLPRRCCIIMTGESRYVWSHGITPRKTDVIQTPSGLTLHQRGTRVSLTFRKVRQTVCSCKYAAYCDSQKRTKTEDIADELEKTHVFKVYEEIAPHFSDTRHKPWPQVLEFVKSLPVGSILVDIGCGNGKYLGHTSFVHEIGCDRSHNLLSLCRSRGLEVMPSDCRSIPLRSGIADGCICIAVIHHLASPDRRKQAIEEIVRLLKPSGRALIYVWAKEQQRGEKRSTYLQQQKNNEEKKEALSEGSSLLPVHRNRTNFQHSDVLVPWKLNPKTASLKDKGATEEAVFHRFYHVFEEGELEALCNETGGVQVRKSYYDQGNWCVILEKVSLS